jgi:hypothetical protein
MENKMRNLSLGIITAALLALLFSPAVRADLVFSLEPGISAGAGSTGNAFDVLLTNTGASSVALGGFSYGIITADTAISFTDADTSTTAPYVFAGDSFVVINGFTLFTNSLPSQTLEASDLSNSGVGAIIASGATVGVGDILFDVASGAAPGSFAVTFEPFPTTSLADPNGGNLDFTAAAGTITITGTVPVPEPATGSLLICAFAAAGFVSLIRRRRANLQQA